MAATRSLARLHPPPPADSVSDALLMGGVDAAAEVVCGALRRASLLPQHRRTPPWPSKPLPPHPRAPGRRGLPHRPTHAREGGEKGTSAVRPTGVYPRLCRQLTGRHCR